MMTELQNITPLDGSIVPLPSVQQLRPVDTLGAKYLYMLQNWLSPNLF